MHPRGKARSQILRTFLLSGGDLEGGSGSFSSFSLCFEEDD